MTTQEKISEIKTAQQDAQDVLDNEPGLHPVYRAGVWSFVQECKGQIAKLKGAL